MLAAVNLALVLRRIDAYERLVRLDKPIGTLLLLWPTLWAVWLAARGRPAWEIVVIFVLGTVLMRSAGCAVNDFADRRFDPHVERTRRRPLAAAEISPAEALAVGAFLTLVGGIIAAKVPERRPRPGRPSSSEVHRRDRRRRSEHHLPRQDRLALYGYSHQTSRTQTGARGARCWERLGSRLRFSLSRSKKEVFR